MKQDSLSKTIKAEDGKLARVSSTGVKQAAKRKATNFNSSIKKDKVSDTIQYWKGFHTGTAKPTEAAEHNMKPLDVSKHANLLMRASATSRNGSASQRGIPADGIKVSSEGTRLPITGLPSKGY